MIFIEKQILSKEKQITQCLFSYFGLFKLQGESRGGVLWDAKNSSKTFGYLLFLGNNLLFYENHWKHLLFLGNNLILYGNVCISLEIICFSMEIFVFPKE